MKNQFLSGALILFVIGLLIGVFAPRIFSAVAFTTDTMWVPITVWTVLIAILSFYLGRKLGGGLLWVIWVASLCAGVYISSAITFNGLDCGPGEFCLTPIDVLAGYSLLGSPIFAVLFYLGIISARKHPKSSPTP